jgi:hypothetical protein
MKFINFYSKTSKDILKPTFEKSVGDLSGDFSNADIPKLQQRFSELNHYDSYDCIEEVLEEEACTTSKQKITVIR